MNNDAKELDFSILQLKREFISDKVLELKELYTNICNELKLQDIRSNISSDYFTMKEIYDEYIMGDYEVQEIEYSKINNQRKCDELIEKKNIINELIDEIDNGNLIFKKINDKKKKLLKEKLKLVNRKLLSINNDIKNTSHNKEKQIELNKRTKRRLNYYLRKNNISLDTFKEIINLDNSDERKEYLISNKRNILKELQKLIDRINYIEENKEKLKEISNLNNEDKNTIIEQKYRDDIIEKVLKKEHLIVSIAMNYGAFLNPGGYVDYYDRKRELSYMTTEYIEDMLANYNLESNINSDNVFEELSQKIIK